MGSLSQTNGKQAKKAKPAPPQFRFINYSLTNADREWLAVADLSTEFPWSSLVEEVETGYKFSLSYDEKSSSYLASLTDRMSGGPHQNTCLTGRGSTPERAFCSLMYRHRVLAQSDWAYFV